MTLHSRAIEGFKRLDALLGIPLARALGGPARLLPEQPRDVLVVRLWGLGNLVLLAPVFAAAAGRVRLLTLRRNADFVAAHFPGVAVLTVPEPHHAGFLPALLALRSELRREPPDLILDCEQFLRLPLLLLRCCCRAPTVGLDLPGQGRGPLLDRPVRHDPTRHVAETFRALGLAAGLQPRPGITALCVDPAARRRVAERLPRGGGPLVVLHPGSGDHFPGRRWPPGRFAELARGLQAACGAQVVLTGVRDEAALLAAVARRSGPAVRSLAGALDAAELVALLARADLLVSNDTGPVHVADAVGTPCVALFGPNTPLRYGPRRRGSRALFADLPCSPCLDDRTMKSSSCRHYACMDALAVDAVFNACAAALGGAGRTGAARERERERHDALAR